MTCMKVIGSCPLLWPPFPANPPGSRASDRNGHPQERCGDRSSVEFGEELGRSAREVEGVPVPLEGDLSFADTCADEPLDHVIVGPSSRAGGLPYPGSPGRVLGVRGGAGTAMAGASVPPSISKTLPVTHDEASETR